VRCEPEEARRGAGQGGDPRGGAAPVRRARPRRRQQEERSGRPPEGVRGRCADGKALSFRQRAGPNKTAFELLEPGKASRMGRARLEVLRSQARVSCNPREHAGPYLVTVVEGEDHVGLTKASEHLVRARSALDLPADAEQRGRHKARPRARPLRHAALKEMSSRERSVSS